MDQIKINALCWVSECSVNRRGLRKSGGNCGEEDNSELIVMTPETGHLLMFALGWYFCFIILEKLVQLDYEGEILERKAEIVKNTQ